MRYEKRLPHSGDKHYSIRFQTRLCFSGNTIVFSQEHNSLFDSLIKEMLKLTEDLLLHALVRLEVRRVLQAVQRILLREIGRAHV